MQNEPKSHNEFGYELLSILQIIRDETLRPTLATALTNTVSALGMERSDIERLVAAIWTDREYSSVLLLEADLHRFIEACVQPASLRNAIDARARLIANQVRPYLLGEFLADIGCGNGLVSWYLCRKPENTTLLDVRRYLDPRVDLPFSTFNENDQLPLNGADTSLLLTVLHHANHPNELLQSVMQCTTQRIIVIESVFGVLAPPAPPFVDISHRKHIDVSYAIFVDWFYNRVLHKDIPVPYNFCTPEKWCSIFETQGWVVTHRIDLGVDQILAPEYHVLFSLSRP